MTDATATSSPTPFSSDRAERAHSRKEGRALIVALHGASRAMKLYPVEHQSVQRAVNEVLTVAEEIREATQELAFYVQGDSIFVNGTRLRLDLTNYTSFGNILSLFRACDLGGVKVVGPTTLHDWLMLVSALTTPADLPPEERFHALVARLAQSNVTAFELESPTEGDGSAITGAEVQAAAKQTYTHSVAISKEVINSVRMGRAPSLKRLKRAVQGIVDQVLTEETSLIGLTTLREYDEYTYTHSVNVCIFSVALGKRLGMTKGQLYELGLAALLHDIGKSRVSADLLQKSGGLTEADWRQLMNHPWLGVLALFQMRAQQELPYRSMVVAHEHHMKCDLSGYPHPLRPRMLSMMSRIVAVADGYDAATTRRAYQTVPYPPSAVLQEMRDNPRRGMDPVVVKAFINLLGIYPVGTLVVLDTFELAVVRSANPNPDFLSRPIVSVVSDAQGHLLDPPHIVDMSISHPDGQFARTIIKTADPDRYGIRVSDYLIVNNPRDTVTLKAMRFHTRVGVLPHESEVAQPVEVDVSVEVDKEVLPPSVVDYSALYADVAVVMNASHINYLEEAAERIATRLLTTQGVVLVHVSVRKPHVALPGLLAYAEVSITRPRGIPS